jgi:hypothetical protein
VINIRAPCCDYRSPVSNLEAGKVELLGPGRAGTLIALSFGSSKGLAHKIVDRVCLFPGLGES